MDRTISMVIPAISCAHCKKTVEGTLKQFDGVKDAVVDIANKRVSLTYDPDRVELPQMEEALAEEGYDVANVQ